MTVASEPLDALGVGVGPANLSLAALLAPHTRLRAAFFDRAERFRWHEGLMFPEAVVQVSFLKDLVTTVCPTSPYTFINFLVVHKRLYRFITAGFHRVPRWQFEEYFRWVAEQLPSIHHGKNVEEITLGDRHFNVRIGDSVLRARNIVLGTGLVPRVPECAKPHLGPTLFHAYRFQCEQTTWAGRRVVIIGGGQTAAEIVSQMLTRDDELPSHLTWISRRSNFQPLDESPFTNELFTPSYSDGFFALPDAERRRLVDAQKLASDGISPGLIEQLYRRLYEIEFRAGAGQRISLRPSRELRAVAREGSSWVLDLHDRVNQRGERVDADLVILCTGFHYEPPACIAPLLGRISRTYEELECRKDFSVRWDGPPEMRIFLQNGARLTRGLADPNLSLLAWRSASIVNSLAGENLYAVDDLPSMLG
jgi:lysine N6-hydroxylase